MSTKHSKAAAEFLKNKKQAAWHDETLWLVRAKRDRLSKEVPEWEELRNMACATKLYSNSHLDELLVEFENNARANGAHVYWAKDADEYCNIVYNILNQHGVKHFIKSKSMLAEECELNPFLESKGIEVVESDLGERILQLMHLKPSHIVLPAIHIKREQVVLEGIILESRNMEQEIYEWIETREIAAKDGESVYCGIMPDYVDILSRLVTLFTVGKIEDKKSLKLIVNRVGDERLKWLMDMENYDYTLFECKWLEWCSQKVLNSITSNQAIRQKILEIYREQYRLRKTTSGVNDIIVQYFLV